MNQRNMVSFEHPHLLAEVAPIRQCAHEWTMIAKLNHAKARDRAIESMTKPANVNTKESAKNCTNCRLVRNNENSPLFKSSLNLFDYAKRSLR
jgi:hypothetical protein